MFYISEKKAYVFGGLLFVSVVLLYVIFGNNIEIDKSPLTFKQLAEYNEERLIADIRATNPKDIREIYNISSDGTEYNFSRYTSGGAIGWVTINIYNMNISNYSSDLMRYDVEVFKKAIKNKGDIK